MITAFRWLSSDIRRPSYVITIVADVLVPNKHQVISNNHADKTMTWGFCSCRNEDNCWRVNFGHDIRALESHCMHRISAKDDMLPTEIWPGMSIMFFHEYSITFLLWSHLFLGAQFTNSFTFSMSSQHQYCVKTIPRRVQESSYPIWSIPLLLMIWRLSKPRHQHLWYWPTFLEISRLQYQNGYVSNIVEISIAGNLCVNLYFY